MMLCLLQPFLARSQCCQTELTENHYNETQGYQNIQVGMYPT